MGNNKRIAKNTLFLYVRMLLVMCVTLYTSRVILTTLGATDYGIYNVVGGIVVLFSFLTGSLAGATSRFLAYDLGEGNQQQLEKTFSASLNIYISIALLIMILGEALGLYFLSYKLSIPVERETAAFWVLQFSLITSFFTFTQYPYTATLLAHENMSIYAYFGIYEAISKLLIAYIITISPIDQLIFYALLLMVNQICILSFYRFYATRNYKECRFRLIKEKPLYKKLLSYSGYDMLPSMGYVFQDQGTNILLNMFFGPVANAARAIAFQVNGALNQLVTNVIQATRPQVIKSYAQGNSGEMYNLTFLAAKFSYLLMLAMVIPLFLEMDYIIHLWLGEAAPNETVIFCRIILLTMLVQTIVNSLSMAMHAIGKLRLFSITNTILYLLPLPVGYLLFKMGFPGYSIFIVSCLTMSLMLLNMLFLLHYTERFSYTDFLKHVLFVCILITLLAIIAPTLLHYTCPCGFVRLVFIVLVTEVTLVFLVWRIAMDEHQRMQLLQMLKSLAPIWLIKQYKKWKATPPTIVYNIGLTSLDQPKVFLSYVNEFLYTEDPTYCPGTREVECASLLSALVQMGCRVDIARYDMLKGIRADYDFIIGQGDAFRLASSMNPAAKRILYLTENPPTFSYEKEKERVQYFEERHHVKVHLTRSGKFFRKEDFEQLHACIFIGNPSDGKKLPGINTFTIKPTGFMNRVFNQEYNKCIRDYSQARKRFMWMGSIGAIHKGLDILLDVFRNHPELELYILGVSEYERRILKPFMGPNIRDVGFIKIQSDEFLNIVTQCGFVVMPSCSERLATSVITAMNHGLIPLVTAETGIEVPVGEVFKDFRVETIDETIMKWCKMDASLLERISHETRTYTLDTFHISNYNKRIKEILDQLIFPTK